MSRKLGKPFLRMSKAIFVKTVTVKDPDTSGSVEIGIYKDEESGGMFGVDASFLEGTEEPVYNPFTGEQIEDEEL